MSEKKTISPEVAFTIISTLREQIEIQKMRIRKLKQQKQQREDLLQINTEDYEDRTVSKAEKSEAKELLTKIYEVLR